MPLLPFCGPAFGFVARDRSEGYGSVAGSDAPQMPGRKEARKAQEFSVGTCSPLRIPATRGADRLARVAGRGHTVAA